MSCHPGLSRVRRVRFLLFKVICVLVYNIYIIQCINLRICLFSTLNTKVYVCKKLYPKKGKKNMYKGSNCDWKSQLSGILTEPLNPRACRYIFFLLWCIVLYCTVLWCTKIYRTNLCYTVLFCIATVWTVMYLDCILCNACISRTCIHCTAGPLCT